MEGAAPLDTDRSLARSLAVDKNCGHGNDPRGKYSCRTRVNSKEEGKRLEGKKLTKWDGMKK
jgi:hypothetical protein